MLEIIKDIEKALQAQAYISAFVLALILPDICGKLEFPLKNGKQRYIDWYDTWLTPYNKPPQIKGKNGRESDINHPGIDGKRCYKLRCSIIHSGNAKDIPEINAFELRVNGCTCFYSITNKCEMDKQYNISLDIENFCEQICCCVKAFYNENEGKINFNNNNFKVRNIGKEVDRNQS